MYPAPFEYHAPSTVQEAVALLGTYQDDAKFVTASLGGSSANNWRTVLV